MKSRYRLSALPRTSGQISITAFLGTTFVASAMLSPAHGQPSQAGSLSEGTPSQSSATTAPLVLDTITVKGKAEPDPADAPYQTPGSSAYISGEQVERFRGTSVGDFLSGIPGVLNADSRNSGAVDVNIRGMQGQGRVPVIVDGATQETTIYQGYNGATPRTYIDPDFISSVSIEKGLSSGADATGATGGVVRASTLNVRDILLPGQSYGIRLKGGFNTNSSPVPEIVTEGGWRGPVPVGPNGELPETSTRFHSNGMRRPALLKPTGGSGSVAMAATTEYADFVAAYVRRKNGNYHAGSKGKDAAHLIAEEGTYGGMLAVNGGFSPFRHQEEILNTSLDNKSWMLKTILRPVGGQSLELGVRQYKSSYGTAFSTRLAASPYENPLSEITLDTYTARYRWNPEGTDLINLKMDAFLTVVDNRVNTVHHHRTQSFDENGEYVEVQVTEPWNEWLGSARRGITAENSSFVMTPLGKFNFQYGGAFVYERVGLPNGVDMEWYRETFNTGYPREGWRKETSGFGSIQWTPWDVLSIKAATRYSRYTTYDKFRAVNQSFWRRDSGWSPTAEMVLQPLESFQVFAKYGRAVRAPSIFESLAGPSFYLPVENNPIRLERARNFEIGLNYLNENVVMQNDKLRAHIAYFDNHINDFLSRAGIKVERPSRSGTKYVEILGRINLDYAKMRGFEASVSYDAGRYFGTLSWNHYTHIVFCAPKGVLMDTDPTCTSGGHPHSYTLHQVPPRNTVTLDIGTRILDQKLTMGSRVNYIGNRFAPGTGRNIGMAGIEPSRWSPYTLFDLYASYKVNKHTSFDLAVDNLTDRYYMDALNAAQMPAPGRTVRGSMTVRF